MIKSQSKYMKKKNSRIWDETFGVINPLLKGNIELITGKWKGERCLNDNLSFQTYRNKSK